MTEATNTTLREFIDSREAEIKRLRSELLMELKELKAAKAAILDGVPASNETRKSPTIKDMILDVLRSSGRAMTSEAIIDGISERFQQDVPRTSLSPQLSRLKDRDGKLLYSETSKEWVLVGGEETMPQSSLSYHEYGPAIPGGGET